MVNTLSYCLTIPHELANFHILEFSLKQFEALGKKHLQTISLYMHFALGRCTQREYSLKPLKHTCSVVERILVFKR